MNIFEQNFIDELIELQQRHGFYLAAGYNMEYDSTVQFRRIEPDKLLQCSVIGTSELVFTEV